VQHGCIGGWVTVGSGDGDRGRGENDGGQQGHGRAGDGHEIWSGMWRWSCRWIKIVSIGWGTAAAGVHGILPRGQGRGWGGET